MQHPPRILIAALAVVLLAPDAPAGELKDELAAYMRARVEARNFSGSVLVARDGEVLLADGYGLADREHGVACSVSTKYRIASISKQFLAASILQLRDAGQLGLADPMTDHVDGGPKAWGSITLHHLLSHQSGLWDARLDPTYDTWSRLPARPQELVEYGHDKPLSFPAGEGFAYSNSGYVCLAAILENVSGRRWEDYVREKILAPLGMDDTGRDTYREVLEHRASGYALDGDVVVHAAYLDMDVAVGGGDLYSTVTDLFLWDQALYTDAVLGAASRTQMMTPNRSDYGYGVRIVEQHGRKRVAHGGGINGFRTQLSRFVDDRVTVIVLCNANWCSPAQVGGDLAAIVFGEPYSPPRKQAGR